MRVHYKSRAELLAAVAAGDFVGKALHVSVLHDDACTPSRCTCEPEYVIEDLTVESLQAGQKRQAKWIKETSS